jgi:hypothetical protein
MGAITLIIARVHITPGNMNYLLLIFSIAA